MWDVGTEVLLPCHLFRKLLLVLLHGEVAECFYVHISKLSELLQLFFKHLNLCIIVVHLLIVVVIGRCASCCFAFADQTLIELGILVECGLVSHI